MSKSQGAGRPTLSVAMIVRDEARHLERSLGSVAELADEMVVVDTGSTDGSDALAARLGARVIHAEWQDDFACARNVSLEAVTGDWVLILDADEEVDYLNAARLRRALAGAAPEIRGFVLLVVSQADHSGSGVEVVSRGARLFRNHLGIRFEGALHEQLVLDGRPLAPELVPVDVSIFHFGYADPLKNQTRAARNLKILRRAAARHSGDPILEFHLAGAAVTAGHHAEAAELYRGLLARKLDPTLEAQVRWNLALARLIADQPTDALAEVDRALISDPERESTRFLRAQILLASGRPAEALAEVSRLLAGGYRRAVGLCEVSPGKAALHALAAECSLALGDVEAAGKSVERAAAADPTFAVDTLRARIAAATNAAAAGRCRAAPSCRPTLTAALIVRNEEMMLPGCLAKLDGVTDEVVVVDTGSTDRTREIARDAGARVLDTPWEEDFARARNFSLEAASGDWVLVIDADERPAPGAGDAIRSFIDRGEGDAAEVTVLSATPDEDPLSSLSARSVRLFRRLPGVEFTGVVHEQVRPSLERLGLVIAASPIVLEHLGYALTKASMRAKQERNLRLLRREVERRGGIMDGLLALHMGIALSALGRDRQAVPSLLFAVSPAGRLGRALVSHAHSRLAQALLKIHDPEAAARHVREALALVPDDLFARYVEAGCLHAAGDPAAAARALAELAARGGDQVRSGPLLLDLGDMRAAAGDLAGAERAYSEASRHLPGDGRPAARLRTLLPCLELSTERP